ncbi:MAG TPA: tRNA lysidine(34) synthetase TilS [Alphaproteobacteria bacterium]|nr:tRNA lysidine(34) synthetase TilS [Alphaproteobacteria bacterium]
MSRHLSPVQAETDGALGPAEFLAMMAALGVWEPHPRLAVAVSGGSDSLALAVLAQEWVRGRSGSLLSLIVDHGLRSNSAAEAEQVRGWLETRGLAAVVLSASARDRAAERGSIQERARRLRYRLLIERCIDAGIAHLLLAHHRDDQAETVLMRMVRGSGLRGMAAIAPVSLAPGSGGRVRLLRPLLAVSKARLRATLEAVGQPWIEDPTNLDPSHERVRWRALMPLLAAAGADPQTIAAGAARMAEERAALDRAAASWLAGAASPSRLGHVRVRLDDLAELAQPVAEAAFVHLLGAVGGGAYPPRRESLRALIESLRHRPGRLTRTLAGCVLSAGQSRLLATREPAAVAERVTARPGLILWDGRFELCLEGPPARLRAVTIAGLGPGGLAELRLRLRRLGAPQPEAPARQLQALPALWQGNRLMEVPHLPELTDKSALARVTWAPRQPLTG